METYADMLFVEWGIGGYSAPIQRVMRIVLSELHTEKALFLRNEPRLEIAVLPEAPFAVWAYFPIHRRRRLPEGCNPKPQTRVLIVLSAAAFDTETAESLADLLRHHIGHVLLYLESPKAPNECADADRTWKESVAL